MKFDKNAIGGAVLGIALTLLAGFIGFDGVKGACQSFLATETPAPTPAP